MFAVYLHTVVYNILGEKYKLFEIGIYAFYLKS
jgi:hypothetical protein